MSLQISNTTIGSHLLFASLDFRSIRSFNSIFNLQKYCDAALLFQKLNNALFNRNLAVQYINGQLTENGNVFSHLDQSCTGP